MPLLSVLICSLTSRSALLSTLLDSFEDPQWEQLTEVIVDQDDGKKPVGQKRNDLLNKAAGHFVAFVDDDDAITDAYLPKITAAITANRSLDCVGIVGQMLLNGKPHAQFVHSIQCAGWYTGGDGRYYRTPNHLNPVRRELALETMFNPAMNIGEDADYSRRLRPLLMSEAMIHEVVYVYNFTQRKPS